jgi:Sulfotransferase family
LITSPSWPGVDDGDVVRVPTSRMPLTNAPIIVLSAARSGSSVITSMIGQHPDLYGFPELVLFAGATVGEALVVDKRMDEWVARNHRFGLLRSIAQLHFGSQSDDCLDAADRWLRMRSRWPIEFVLDQLFEAVAPLVAIEKSPVTTSSDASIARATALYPTGFFVHLVRHPISTIDSMLRHWAAFAEMGIDVSPPVVARGWLMTQRRTLLALRRVPASRQVRIRAEDVLNSPCPELARIASLLGVSTGRHAIERMLHPEESVYASLGGGNDPLFLWKPSPRPMSIPPSLDVPSSWGIPAEIAAALQKVGMFFGYQN